jgi:hypothetical protein
MPRYLCFLGSARRKNEIWNCLDGEISLENCGGQFVETPNLFSAWHFAAIARHDPRIIRAQER